MYYRDVPDISNRSWRYEYFKIKPVGKAFIKTIFDTFCGTNISSTK